MKGTKKSATLSPGLLMFYVSSVVLLFFYGVAVGNFKIFPYQLFEHAAQGFEELKVQALRFNIVSEQAEGEKKLVIFKRMPKPYPEPISNTSSAMQGVNFVTRLSGDFEIIAELIDMEGQQLHRWNTDWFRVWPKSTHIPKHLVPKSKPGSHIHGAVVLENGDLIFNFEHLGLIRLDRHSEVVWRLPYRTHHSVYQHDDGNLWVCGQKAFESRDPLFPQRPERVDKYTLLEVSPAGEILHEWFVADILHNNGYAGLLHLGSIKPGWIKQVKDDRLHLNDVEPFPDHLSEGFFKRGDVLVSLRNVNTIFVFNKHTGKIKYLSTGQFVNQHDPDFIDGNRFSVLDNNNKEPLGEKPRYSRIMILSPLEDKVEVFFEGSPENAFFTEIMGKHQWLSNGNLLITESTMGRAFELNPEGEIVWEYVNYVGDGIVGVVEEVSRLPKNYAGF